MKSLLFVIVIVLGYSSSALALKFSPIYATLKPDGRAKSFTFHAENPSDKKIAVEISINHRVHDLEGKEINESASEKFNIFPTQMVLKPKQRRTVRITWLGKEKVDKELAFRLVADQLPIKGLGTKKKVERAGIQILMQYVASVYVEPEGVASNIAVIASEIKEVDGKAMLELMVENKGNKHQVMAEPVLNISYTNKDKVEKKVKFTSKQLKTISDSNILPTTKRKYLIPWPGSKYIGPVKASLKLSKEG